MSDIIVIFRMPDGSLSALNDDEGFRIATFPTVVDAAKAVHDHPFIEHQEYQILEVDI